MSFSRQVTQPSSEALEMLSQLLLQPPKEFESIDDRILLFGGLDLAKRIDSSCLTMLELKHGILNQADIFQWPHVKYGLIAKGVKAVHQKFPMEQLGFDRSGVGDAASELFSENELPMVPIKMTIQMKLDIIHIMRILLNVGRLKIERGSQLQQEITEQQEETTNAGNQTYKHPVGKHDDQFWSLGYACFVALPYMINMPPAIVKVGFRKDAFDHVDFEQMIQQLMGGNAEVQQFF